MNSELEVGKSDNGRGLFAKKFFGRNQKVFEIRGKLIHHSVLMEKKKKIRNNTFRFSEEYYLSPEGNLGDFVNHSCSSNSKVKKIRSKLYIFSIKPVRKGEEILIDYSTILARDDFWVMKCKCGNKKCRHKIEKFSKLPKKVYKKYIDSKMIPDYIIRIKQSDTH